MCNNMKLRNYQEDLIEKLRTSLLKKNKKMILCAPTGSGKTVMFSFMVKKHIEKGGRVLVLTHRKELMKQSGGTFHSFGLDPEFISANNKTPDLTKTLHVSMIETFNRRLSDYQLFLSHKTMIVIDEAHINSFTKIFHLINENQIVVGATATPYRKGKDIPALEMFYQDLIQGVQVADLIKLGFLSKPKTYGVKVDLSKAKLKGDDYDTSQLYSETKLYKGVYLNYAKISYGKKTMIFASNVANSIEVCREFNDNGVLAKHIDANTPSKDRESILDWFENTDNAVLCNCGILTAGYDHSEIETIILYRATTSLPLFLQMCGRGSRVSDSKKEFNILDFGNNVRRLGFWEENRTWSLKKDKKRTAKEDAFPVKDCPECDAMLPVSTKVCPYCDYYFKKTDKEKEQDEIAELQLLTKKEVSKFASKRDVDLWVKLVHAKKLHPFRIFHMLEPNEIDLAYEFMEKIGYKKGFAYLNKNRFRVFG